MKPFYDKRKKEFVEISNKDCVRTEDLFMQMMADIEVMKKKNGTEDTNEFGKKSGEELPYMNVSPANFARMEEVGVGKCMKVLCSDGIGGFEIQIIGCFEQPKEEEENLSPREKMIKKNLIIPAEKPIGDPAEKKEKKKLPNRRGGTPRHAPGKMNVRTTRGNGYFRDDNSGDFRSNRKSGFRGKRQGSYA